ncbi:hypothetical protein KKE19_01885 [Patescibacteria group bacterium]|nr:hypothetical protein [Patescibacteria group bacterium]MBU4274543.1 hypothetical protein [Patescibacteria group bacterium]MBU4367448.1 hypothetical protein [Patescibacteria group bacterium]MBU4461768.1 hypothetical protein [Patescibacteria group bacterium]MCG2700152.1 hypothetical protein [Candidatus Parcubacteria bacterium]
MIFIVHLIIGAAIASKIKFLPLVILLALLSHYFLDSLPHAEYSIKNIKEKKWNKSKLDFLKLTLDLTAGLIIILIVYFTVKINHTILFAACFFAVLPDILVVFNWMFPNNDLLKKHFNFHHRIHFPEDKKIPAREKLIIELLVVLLGFLLLLVKV